MKPNNNQVLLIISFFSLIFFNPARAICVPRNFTSPNPSPPPHSPPLNLRPVFSGAPPPHSPPLNLRPVSPESGIGVPPEAVSAPPDPSVASSHPIIKKICDQTDYPTVCFYSIVPFLTGKTDIPSVLGMAIKACTQFAKVALSAASKLAIGLSDMAINDCVDIYSDALDNLQSATDAIVTGDIGTINSMISAAMTDFETCEDGFAGGSSPMAFFEYKLRKMTSNCLAIASLIK